MATPINISILKIIVFLYRYITYDKHLVVHKVSQNKITPNETLVDNVIDDKFYYSYPFYCQVKLSHLDQ